MEAWRVTLQSKRSQLVDVGVVDGAKCAQLVDEAGVHFLHGSHSHLRIRYTRERDARELEALLKFALVQLELSHMMALCVDGLMRLEGRRWRENAGRGRTRVLPRVGLRQRAVHRCQWERGTLDRGLIRYLGGTESSWNIKSKTQKERPIFYYHII